MSHTASGSTHEGLAPSPGLVWLRTLAIAAVAALAATLATLAVQDVEAPTPTTPVEAPAPVTDRGASWHDSELNRLIRDRAAAVSSQHDSGIERARDSQRAPAATGRAYR